MFEFDDLEDLLTRFHIPQGTAESHGFLTGYLCVSESLTEEAILEFFLAEVDSESVFLPDCLAAFEALAEDIRQQLKDPEFSFQILMPDDSFSIMQRSDALAEWCQGFLSGLGVVGQANWQGLSAQCHDIIADFYKICRLSADEELDDEEAEEALSELYEYVRMGVLYIHDEFSLMDAEYEQAEVIH